MKKNFYIFLLVAVCMMGASVAYAQNPGDLPYTPLEPGVITVPAGSQGFSAIVESLFKILFSLGALLAVGMITFGGIQYMMTDVPGVKKASMERLWAAVIGLSILAGSYLILNTINPELLKFRFDLGAAPTPSAPSGPSYKELVETYGASTIRVNKDSATKTKEINDFTAACGGKIKSISKPGLSYESFQCVK